MGRLGIEVDLERLRWTCWLSAMTLKFEDRCDNVLVVVDRVETGLSDVVVNAEPLVVQGFPGRATFGVDVHIAKIEDRFDNVGGVLAIRKSIDKHGGGKLTMVSVRVNEIGNGTTDVRCTCKIARWKRGTELFWGNRDCWVQG